MFTIPAIHHPSVKVEDGSMGTLHLNALNGSSNVLGYNNSDNSSRSGQNGVFGGLIGVSLSENHPYRPQDCGMTFHETTKSSHRKCTTTSPLSVSSTSSRHGKSSSGIGLSDSKRTVAMDSFRCSEAAPFSGPRRHSLDLDLVSANAHRRYKDRKLSLDELLLGPFSRTGPFLDDAIDEQEQASDLDIAGLSLTEVSIKTSDAKGTCHISDASRSNQAKKKKKRSLTTTDVTMSEKAHKLLEKIKDNRRDHNSNFKHSHHRSEITHKDSDLQDTPSKADSLRHNILRHLSDHSAEQKHELDGHHKKNHKKIT